MLKLLAPLILVLLAGGVWWFASSESAAPVQQGLSQESAAKEPNEGPEETADLTAPNLQERVQSPGRTPSPNAAEPARTAPQDLPLDADLPPSGSPMMVRAFIVDWNNQPVRNASLTVGIGRLAGGGEINGYGSAVFQTESDADGRLQTELRIPSVDWTQMAVSVEDPQREAMGWVEPVKVLIDGHGDLGTIKIYETREKFPNPILSGRVLSEAGKPVSPVFVTVGPSMDFEIEIQGFNPGTQVPLDRERGQVILDPEGYFQAFGPDTWESVEVTALSPGFHDESQSVSVPSTGIQLTLYRRLQLAGRLIVPENGPPIGEFGIWLSQEGGGIGITPRSDGTFSGQGSSQSLNLQITHPTLGAVLFRNDFVAAPTEEAGLGTVDLRDLVHVVDVTVVDMNGNPLANQELTIAADELQTIGGPFTTDGEGRLLTLIPRHITTIHLSKRGGFVTTKVEPVELMLPSSPTRVTMP